MSLVRSLFIQQRFPYIDRIFNFKILKSTSNSIYSKFRQVSYFDPASREPLIFEQKKIVKESNRELLEPLYVEPRRFRGTLENPIVITHMYSVMNVPCMCSLDDHPQIILLRNNHTQCPKCRNYYYLMKGETYPNLKIQYDESVSDKCNPGRLGHRHMD